MARVLVQSLQGPETQTRLLPGCPVGNLKPERGEANATCIFASSLLLAFPAWPEQALQGHVQELNLLL
jgi:hypothetical protein